MYVEHEIVARLSNHCCNGKATMPYVCIVEVHIAVKSIRILSVARTSFMANLYRPR